MDLSPARASSWPSSPSTRGPVGLATSTRPLRPPLLLLLLLVASWPGPGSCKPAVPRGAPARDRVATPPRPDAEGGQQRPEEVPPPPILDPEEARAFESLGPEQSKRRLAALVERMDVDEDGLVSRSELRVWIKFTQRRYAAEEVARHWREYDADRDDHVSWDEYRNTTYGSHFEEDGGDGEEGGGYRRMLARDRRRFSHADGDADGRMTREEFSAFLHPDEHEHMAELVITETIEDLDKDGDGTIDIEEYIGDMFSREPSAGDDADGERQGAGAEEPEWVRTERAQFLAVRDTDGDGRMGRAETRAWVLPSDYDHADIEAQHLVHESDADADGKLSVEEILNKFDLFIGSQATNFGEELKRHDEF
ncbi:LOW QUALITY PROTEIN: calumenin-A-like [Lampetra fluviatilis]